MASGGVVAAPGAAQAAHEQLHEQLLGLLLLLLLQLCQVRQLVLRLSDPSWSLGGFWDRRQNKRVLGSREGRNKCACLGICLSLGEGFEWKAGLRDGGEVSLGCDGPGVGCMGGET